MRKLMKPRDGYYSVHALRDGTILLALPENKPRRHQGERGPVADQDGCFNWFEFRNDEVAKVSESSKLHLLSVIANRLNMKKLIRNQVETRLEKIERQLIDLDAAIKRIESKFR